MARKSRGGPGILGALAVVGLLTFTSAGSWLLARTQDLSANCYSLVPRAAYNIGGRICSGLAWAVDGVTRTAETVGSWTQGARGLKQDITDSIPFSGDRYALSRSLENAVAGLSSSTERLNDMVRAGPQSLSLSGGSVAQQFQQAVDSFTIGQHYMRSGGENSAYAVPWLQQGARQPNGFGMLSQLSLGDIYRNGTGGVKVDAGRAEAYYRQAEQSLSDLSRSNAPEAQQILGSLPVSKVEMQQKISTAIREARAAR
jgi:hypothetical protein